MRQKDFFSFLTHRTDPIQVSAIPEALYPDIEAFMFGKTCMKWHGEMAYFACDFNNWVDKVANEGLSYPLQLSSGQ